jgi:hypothetical protein
LSAFLFYFIEKRSELQSANPDKKVTEITTLLASSWKSLKDEEKQPYMILAE